MNALRDSPYARLLPMMLAASLLSSCSRAPSIEVLGSFFPAWLVSFIGAIVLTAFARLALLRLRVKPVLPMLLYPSVAALFTFVLWLLFFY